MSGGNNEYGQGAHNYGQYPYPGQRAPAPSMSPPRHLPFHVIPPEQLEQQRQQAQLQQVQFQQQNQNTFMPVNPHQTPNSVLSGWTPPTNHPFWRTSALSFEQPSGPPPAPPPSKPVTGSAQFGEGLSQQTSHPPPSLSPPVQSQRNLTLPNNAPTHPLDAQRQSLMSASPVQSQKPKKKRKKKKLNKFSSAEIQRESEPGFVPRSNPLPPVLGVKVGSPPGIRGRRNSKNASSAFIVAASPNNVRFDTAMERMQAKMKKQTKNVFELEPDNKIQRSKQKSKQVQSSLSVQFGFLQNKFQHKQKQGTKKRPRKKKQKRAPALATTDNTNSNAPGISSWI